MGPVKGSHGHRVQFILFLVAIFVPCTVLIALGVRMMNQDRELRVKRQADEQRQVVDEARKALLALLDSIQLDETRRDLEPGEHYRHPETVFVAWAEEGRLVLPWDPERDRAARTSGSLIAQPDFETSIRACGQPAARSPESEPSAQCYQRASAAAKHPTQAAYARWLSAQALEGAGQSNRAAPLFRALLDTGPEVTDNDGIPLKLHAAQSLLQTNVARGPIVAAVESVLASRPWLPPMSSFVVKEIAARTARLSRSVEDTGAAEELGRQAAVRIRVLEQAESLQNDFPRLGVKRRPQASWTPYGDDTWLLAAVNDSPRSSAVLAVRLDGLFQRLRVPRALRFTDFRVPEGEALGENFPGLKVVVASSPGALPDPGGSLQRGLFYLTLSIVVSATLFAAYLLWRDVRREMRLSDLRAQFVSSVSHELKTPLTAIRMFAETLQMGRCADPQVQTEYLGTIVSECERLSRLVDGVLLFSKIEQGKRTFRFRPVQAADALQAAARAMEYPLSQQGFQLRMAVQDDLPLIHADRDALEQALLNLLSNALKFSGDARTIELGLCRENGDIVIRVTDHGCGIAPQEQSRIFDRYYRVPTPENQLIPGTGLGLTLVAQIARAHGGRVEVASAPGQGSTFSLHIPIHPGDHAGQEGLTIRSCALPQPPALGSSRRRTPSRRLPARINSASRTRCIRHAPLRSTRWRSTASPPPVRC